MIYVLIIHVNFINIVAAYGRTLQNQQDTMDNIINDCSRGGDALSSLFHVTAGQNVCHPFDLNDPQHQGEQENILSGNYFQ